MFKSFPSDQDEPFHSSVIALFGSPPKHKLAVTVPLVDAPTLALAVFKSVVSDQADPFQVSVAPVPLPGEATPPKTIPAVIVPVH